MKSSLILTRLLTQEKKTLNINIMTKGLVTTELIYIYITQLKHVTKNALNLKCTD